TDFDAIHIFAFDAIISNDIGHRSAPGCPVLGNPCREVTPLPVACKGQTPTQIGAGETNFQPVALKQTRPTYSWPKSRSVWRRSFFGRAAAAGIALRRDAGLLVRNGRGRHIQVERTGFFRRA